MRRALFLTLLLAVPSIVAAENPEGYPRVRQILVQPQDVFSDEDFFEDDALPFSLLDFVFRTANAIHLDTRAHVIKRELLVQEGGLADPELLAESERNLRNLQFVRRVNVVTKPVREGWVDVIVRAQDTWTTEPRLSYSSGGGTQETEFGLVEKNLLGFGKTLSVRYETGIDRDSAQFKYADPRVWGTRWAFTGNFEETSDGRVFQTAVRYPFFSLETPWSAGVRYASVREQNRIFAPGEGEISEFDRDAERIRFDAAMMLPGSDPKSRVSRLGLFYRWNDENFASRGSGLEPLFVPRDRRQSVPGLFYQRQEVRFVRERHFNVFDRVEDFNVGNVLNAELGFSSRALGGFRDEPVFTISDRQGFDLGPGRKAFFMGLVRGRWDGGDFRNTAFEVEGIVFNRVRLLWDQTFVLRSKLDIGRNLDRDFQIFLGNDNGLRGFPTRELVGSKRFVVNVEDRLFFVNDLLRLISLGGVLFFDAGNVWPSGDAVEIDDLRASAGVGLRIGAPRSAGEKIWRFDLAIPIRSADREEFGVGFSFGSGQAFSPFNGPFELQTFTRQ